MRHIGTKGSPLPMKELNAFVARSFAAEDEKRIPPILDFLDTFRKVGFFWETAEPAEVESVSAKVRRMIDEKEVFIAFFTRRNPIYKFASKIRGAAQVLFGNTKPQAWSAPAWVLQESGYALRGEREVILLREVGVEVPGLQGDLEYITFDPDSPAEAFSKINEMIHGLLAKVAGTELRQTIIERREEAQVAIEPAPAEASAAPAKKESGPESNIHYFIEMNGASKKRDFDAMHKAWEAGTKLITEGKDKWVDQLSWDCAYQEFRFEAGASDGLETLRRLRTENSESPEPILAIARCLEGSEEFEEAAQLFLEASSLRDGENKARSLVEAATAYIKIKKYAESETAIEAAIPIATGDLREEAIRLQYQILKDSGNDYLAFATAEYALHENPQFSIRFSLGLDYHRQELNQLALLHFKFLHDRNKEDSSSLHNLALMYSDCKLPIASIKHYKTAFALGNTLSAANLGFLYLDCGMADEAKTIADRAMEADDHVPWVEKCLAEIVRRNEEETEKETALLEEASGERNLLAKMGRALVAALPALGGRWKFPFGEMPLRVVSGRLLGTAEVSTKTPLLGASLVDMGSPSAVRTDKYTLNGKLRGSVCQFDLFREDTGEHVSLSSLMSAPKSKSGFILFEPDGKSASYIELSDDKLGKSETIFKLS